MVVVHVFVDHVQVKIELGEVLCGSADLRSPNDSFSVLIVDGTAHFEGIYILTAGVSGRLLLQRPFL